MQLVTTGYVIRYAGTVVQMMTVVQLAQSSLLIGYRELLYI